VATAAADNVQRKIRVHGIDAPELGQPFGRVARDRLTDLLKGKTVAVVRHGRDRYGRVLATIDAGGQDVGRRLVTDGLAWHYTRVSKDAGYGLGGACVPGHWTRPWGASERRDLPEISSRCRGSGSICPSPTRGGR